MLDSSSAMLQRIVNMQFPLLPEQDKSLFVIKTVNTRRS